MKNRFFFVTKRHRKFHPYAQLPHTKISYLLKNKHLRKDAAFLHFRFIESSENMIFPWNGNIRKLMKIWPFLSFSQIFIRRKFFFSYSDININSTPSDRRKSPLALAMINNTCWMMVLALYHATILVCCKYLGNLSVIFSEDFAIYLNFKKLKTEMKKAS